MGMVFGGHRDTEAFSMNKIDFPLETRHFTIKPKDEDNLWREDWSICLKNGDDREIGTLRFEEASFHGEVHFSSDLDPAYDKEYYSAEIFYAMARFAFRYRNIREISTVCRQVNEHRVKGLEKAGYVRRQSKDGDVYYSMKKQKTSWTGLYIFVGMIAGFLIGITVSNLWTGTCAGLLIGIIIGILMDKREQKDQGPVTELEEKNEGIK